MDNIKDGLAGVDISVVAPLFTIAQTLIPGYDIQLFPGIKHRLNMSMDEVFSMYDADKIIRQKGLDWAEVLASPEQDKWKYGEKKQESYPCPRLIVEFWKAGGLFEGLDINGVEFAPKDIY
mmetsp:Transcript_7077/g.6324  ORF Transcript_7077/g.6324 Transcript_7077/m.6324 type:complete len:121 (-) Transcript_7077:60-422(-)